MSTELMSKSKNNVTTQGYFVKRLRDNGFYVVRLFDRYGEDDYRKWTVLINPKIDSLVITCVDNGDWPYRGLYEFNDGGRKFPKGFYINTDSMEVVIKHLLEFKIDQITLNNNDGRQKKKKTI
jgi:hypothetical protein